MPDLKATIEKGLTFIEQKLGNQTFAFQGETYPCHPGSLDKILELQSGGFGLGVDLVLIVRVSVFTDGILPVSQQKLTYKNATYRIEKVIQNVNEAFIRIICVSPDRKK